MKLSKIWIVNHSGYISSLNIAIGEKALQLYSYTVEAQAVAEPFEKFRTKLVKDLGLEGKTFGEAPEGYKEFSSKIEEFLKGEVEVKTNFLTKDEFHKAMAPLFKGSLDLFPSVVQSLEKVLVEDFKQEKEENHKAKSKQVKKSDNNKESK